MNGSLRSPAAVLRPKYLLVGLFMLVAAIVATTLKPTTKIADAGPKPDLEALIPLAFGDWKVDTSVAPLVVNPQTAALIDKLYSETLERTYVNSRGERIMLSIAYGGDQSDSMQVHKPEVCYPAQGFQILKNADDVFQSADGSIPVRRLVASQGQRVEPITYWTTVGDSVAVDGLSWKLRQLKYGLTGSIPDGLLFRVSSIRNDDAEAYRAQDEFTRALLTALTPAGKQRIIGRPDAAT